MKYIFLVMLLLLVASNDASADVPECERLAEVAGSNYGISAGLMAAIARVESGRMVDGRFRAWPWTLNQAGRGSFHPDKTAALERLKAVLETGVRNVDVGCMQINWHWHAANFRDLSEMIDPIKNTRYAARYLLELYQQLGDWEHAVMQYHSRNPRLGAAYASKVTREMTREGHVEPEVMVSVASSEPALRGQAVAGLLVRPSGALIDLSPGLRSRSP